MAFFLLAFTGVFSSYFFSQRVTLQVGQIAPETITASRQVLDPVVMDGLKNKAAAKVAPVYVNNPDALPYAKSLLQQCFTGMLAMRFKSGLTAGEVVQRACNIVVPQSVGANILNESAGQFSVDMKEANTALTVVMQTPIRPGDSLVLARDEVGPQLFSQGVTGDDAVFLNALVGWLVQPNQILDANATKQRQDAAMAKVPPHYLLKGQMIVQKGTKVTSDDLKRLAALGRTSGVNLTTFVGGILFTLVFFATVWLYFKRFQREALANDGFLVMLGLISLLTFLLAVLLNGISPYLVPLAASTMLLTILADGRLAILFAFLYLLGIALTLGVPVQALIPLASGALAGTFAVSKVAQRVDLMRAGLYVAGGSVLGVLSSFFLQGPFPLNAGFWQALAWSGVNGVVSSVITIGCLPFLESFFGILTPIKLLELSNPNQPLLRELMLKAPGSYHHSLVVANLAEAAAEAVGADPLLTRVGAYYHDIGKMKRPYFFIDNQFGGKNPHDKISPALSTLIVTSHVKDGLQMAKEHRLHAKIADFIAEHHGTTLVRYFFSRAEELREKGKKLGLTREDDFRYDGPKPKSVEAAIVMLADSVEAAVRSIKEPMPGHVEGTVHRILQERLHDGQLNESKLTLKELDTVARVFTHVLMGVGHQRIEYPPLSSTGTNGESAAKGYGERLS